MNQKIKNLKLNRTIKKKYSEFKLRKVRKRKVKVTLK